MKHLILGLVSIITINIPWASRAGHPSFTALHWNSPLPHSPLPYKNGFEDVSYYDGRFIAVGESHALLISPDGTHWNEVTVGTNSIRAIAHGLGQFVGVGRFGAVFYSADAIRWSPGSSGTGAHFSDVVFGDGRFVAVGDGVILASTDGKTWTPAAAGGSHSLNAITFGKGVYAAVGGATVLTSRDAANWVAQESGVTNGSLTDVVFGNGMFVAGGLQGAVLTSSDGGSWISRRLGTPAAIYALAHGGDRFVGVSPGNGGESQILVSTDGSVWAAKNVSTGQNPRYFSGIAFGSDRWVAVTSSSSSSKPFIMTSTNLHDWTFIGVSIDAFLTRTGFRALAFGKDKFFAGASYGHILSSTTGIEWSVKKLDIPVFLTGLAFGAERFVGVGEAPGYTLPGDQRRVRSWAAATSLDGEIWTVVLLNQSLRSVAHGSGKFVAVGEDGYIAISTDGSEWSAVHSGTTNGLWHVASSPGALVAVGGQGTILVSSDAEGWRASSAPVPNRLHGVAYGSGLYVAVGEGGLIVTSRDAALWTSVSSGDSTDLWTIAYGAGMFVAAGGRSVLTSVDGVRWIPRASVANIGPAWIQTPAAYGNGMFLLLGTEILQGTPAEGFWAPPRITAEGVRLLFHGEPAHLYQIEATPDLGSPAWVPVGLDTNREPAEVFLDREGISAAARYYRAVRLR